jgi:tetratricopeptide (TPR) repeat protein
MIERLFPYGGVPVYNPQSLSKGEALAQFHARQAAYQSLIDLLREERPSHVLIIGTRGMGKTTLLQRVRYGVEDDVELNGRYLVLAFPEEQYNVNRLHHFLLNTVDALADALEKLHNERMLARVEAYVDEVGKLSPEEIAERVPQFLAETGQQMQKSFLLLVDNADRLFETIEDKEQWRLRELLSSRRDLTLFGATTQASDGIYGADRAFFEFFKIHRLTPLTLQEVRDLLLQLSESVEEKEGEKGAARRRVEEWLAADAARLRTLVQLTGGNPRTTVLLFHLVLDGLTGGAREYLEQLLDQCTPNYKGRVDDLPAQAQQVLDAVALRWDPVTAMEVAEDTRLETSTVSTQLTRLVRQGLLEKADPGDSKKALYQVAERFFNIWYLMRASRRVRAKLRWFVEFLRVFFDSDELEKMALERMERFRGAGRTRSEEIETAFAYALASGEDRRRFEDYLRRKCADSEPEWRPYLDLIRCAADDGLHGTKIGDGSAKTRQGVEGNRLTVTEAAARKSIEFEPDKAENWLSLGHVLSHKRESAAEAEAALRKSIELDPMTAASWSILGSLLVRAPERRGEAEVALRKAIELNPKSSSSWNGLGDVLSEIPEQSEEAEACYRKAMDLDPKFAGFWNDLGILLLRTPARMAEAEAALRKAIELDPKSSSSWNSLGDVLREIPEQGEEAEACYRKAIDLDPKFGGFWNDLGILLSRTPARMAEAEAALRKAIELGPKVAGFWSNLGGLLARTPERMAEAEAALREAIDLDPKYAWAWAELGDLLEETPERREEAEAALRKAVELDPESHSSWHNLGNLLLRSPGREEAAEAALRKAVELYPRCASSWSALGSLLGRPPERSDQAEAALRKAIDLDPKYARAWAELGNLLEETPERREEAEAAFGKALEIDPRMGYIWGALGFFLACRARKPKEAEVAFRKALELEPDSSRYLRNLGELLYCELLNEKEAVDYLRRAHQLKPTDPASAGIFAACVGGPEAGIELLRVFLEAAHGAGFWDEILGLCQDYAPFGKILLGICDLVQEHDRSNLFVRLHRAVAVAQLDDFPRASVALEDALVGDPIDLLATGRKALEVFFAAAVRNGRVRDCIEILDRKEWRDAWRPIYEALRSVEAGSGEYLKRVAVEIREPALLILRRIAPVLPGLPGRTR